MSINYTIGAILERYEDYVKPFFYNLPYIAELEKDYFEYKGKQVIDSKRLGITFCLFYAMTTSEESDIKLEVILTDSKEEHKGWIELYREKEDSWEYKVSGLDSYRGEKNAEYHNPGIDLRLFGIEPKYIYLKKIPCSK